MRDLLLSLCLVLPAGFARAEAFDYTTCWTHLTDQELHHFLYDCGGVVDLAVKGNIAYAVDDGQGMQVIDCTDPLEVVYRGFVGISHCVACGVREHFVFVVNRNGTVVVVDVDEEDAPEILSQTPTGAEGRDLVVNGTWLYVLSADDALRVYSIASATQPALVRVVPLPVGRDEKLALSDDRLVAAGQGGLAIFDLTLPDWPALRGTEDFSGEVLGLDLRDDLALVGHEAVSRLYDVGDPEADVVRKGCAILIDRDGLLDRLMQIVRSSA